MTREVILIEDHDEFVKAVKDMDASSEEKTELYVNRWDYLYDKYKPLNNKKVFKEALNGK